MFSAWAAGSVLLQCVTGGVCWRLVAWLYCCVRAEGRGQELLKGVRVGLVVAFPVLCHLLSTALPRSWGALVACGAAAPEMYLFILKCF